MKIININNPLVKLAMSPKYIDMVKDKTDLPFENIFNGQLRLVIPVISKQTQEIRRMLMDGETESNRKYNVNLDDKTATTIIQTDKGPKLITYSLGKIIHRELGQRWADIYSHIAKADPTKENQQSIIISRSPIDILRMSDVNARTSCHSEGGSYFNSAIQEALDGGAIAYVVNNEDLTKIQDLQQKEIFQDDHRKIAGIKPVSRLRINRYTNDEQEIAIPINSEYYPYNSGPIPGFFDTLTDFFSNKQEIYKEIQEQLNNGTNTKK